MSTRTSLGVLIVLLAVARVAPAQRKSAADTVTPRFTIGSTQVVAGYARFDFADLDARIAAAGLPSVARSAATVGIGTDIRSGRLLLGIGFQSLITRDHRDAAYRMRLAGRYTLLDAGIAALQTSGWSVYPLAGLGLTSLQVSVRERGDFTFDEALERPSRELGMSGLGALAHAGLLIERRFHRRDAEYAIALRAGVTRSFGSQAWTSDANRVAGGPSGLRGSYVRLAFSRPLRARRDAMATALGTVAQAAIR
jgi:hypothetical protein